MPGWQIGDVVSDGPIAGAVDDGRRALDLARQSGHPGLEALALGCLSVATWHGGDRDGAFRLARQAHQFPGDVAGALQRGLSQLITMVLADAGDMGAAEQACAMGLARCRKAGDLTTLAAQLWNRVMLDLHAHRTGDAAAHLRDQLEIATQTGVRAALLADLDCCGHLCAATGRQAAAVTVWAAMSALGGPGPLPLPPLNAGRWDKLLRKARELLGQAGTRAAERRGAPMSPATATEYALLLAAARGPSRITPGPTRACAPSRSCASASAPA